MPDRVKESGSGAVANYRQILLDLFHPQTEHADGCLFKSDRRMPCQCGWSNIAIRYNAALRQARALAAAHYQTDAEPMAGGDYPADDTALVKALEEARGALRHILQEHGGFTIRGESERIGIKAIATIDAALASKGGENG